MYYFSRLLEIAEVAAVDLLCKRVAWRHECWIKCTALYQYIIIQHSAVESLEFKIQKHTSAERKCLMCT